MLKVYNLEEKIKWNKILDDFKMRDIYYQVDYLHSFQVHGDGDPMLFYFDDGKIRAVNAVMKRDIAQSPMFKDILPSGKYYDIATPYGYGGFLIEGDRNLENLKNLFEQYNQYCQVNGIVSEFVRFHPLLKNQEPLEDEYRIMKIGKTIHIDLQDRGNIWQNFTSKNRNVIRKAQKSNIKISFGLDNNLMEKFIELYNDTMKRAKAKEYYFFDEEFYDSILENLKDNMQLFFAEKDDRIIAIAMILFVGNRMHYHLSASDRDFSHLAATNLLLYEASCWGSDKGYTIFHLGGGLGSKEDNLYKFKKAFNKDSDNDFFIGSKIFDKKTYNELLNLRLTKDKEILDHNFFPAYRG